MQFHTGKIYYEGIHQNRGCITADFFGAEKNDDLRNLEYFEDKNRKKLVSLVKKIYKEKDKKVKFKIKESLWKGYNDIFID